MEMEEGFGVVISGSQESLVRNAQESSSGEYIAEDAARWKAEAFIPVAAMEMKQALLDRLPSDSQQQDAMRHVFESLTAILNHDYRNLHQSLELHYSVLDPDRDLKLISRPEESELVEAVDISMDELEQVLRSGNFTRLDRDEIKQAMKTASQWGVRLNIDLDVFDRMEVYARGDVIGMRTQRRWQDYWRLTEVEVPVYQRLVAIFKLKQDAKLTTSLQTDYDRSRLHLSMFKNIPKADVDMLLPAANIQFSWLDRTKILMPTLSGLGMTLIKILRGALVIAVSSMTAIFGVVVVVAGIIGYAVRSVFSYFHTHDKYLLNMTRSLYFQKLDSNAGVVYRLLQEARQQDLIEAIIGYFVLHTNQDPLTQLEFAAAAEELVEEIVDVRIRFDGADAVQCLSRLGVVLQGGGDTYSVMSPQSAMYQFDKYWDNLMSPKI